MMLLTVIVPMAAWGTAPERTVADSWVRDRVMAGEGADLSAQADCRDAEPGAACRTLSPAFLRWLLTVPPGEAKPHPGPIRIRNAFVREPLDLQAASIVSDVLIENTIFAGPLLLSSARMTGELTLRDVRLEGGLTAKGLRAHELRFSCVQVVGGDFSLNDAVLEGRLFFEQVGADGDVHAERLRADGFVLHESEQGRPNEPAPCTVRPIVEGRMWLGGARISGQMHVAGVTLRNGLFAPNIAVRDFHVNQGAQLLCRRLPAPEGATILPVQERAGQPCWGLHISGAVVDGYVSIGGEPVQVTRPTRLAGLHAEGIQVRRNLQLGHLDVQGEVRLAAASVTGSVSLAGATLRSVHLRRARIDGELDLGSLDGPRIRWEDPNSLLDLRQARIGGLLDWWDGARREDAWPPRLALTGLTYNVAPGVQSRQSELPYGRAAEWYRRWLQLDQDNSPGANRFTAQPYQELADALRRAGDRERANDVLRQAWNHKQEQARQDFRQEAVAPIDYFWLLLLGILLQHGVGFGWLQLIVWIGLLTITGAVVMSRQTWRGRLSIPALLVAAFICLAWLWPSIAGWVVPVAGILLVVGAVTHRFDKWPATIWAGDQRKDFGWCLAASFDRLLPGVQLSPQFDHYFGQLPDGRTHANSFRPSKQALDRGQFNYFLFHTLFGYVLVVVVAAGLAGLVRLE
jgi:hypothetical protein